jgi:glycosyltransferase involved in cell wall biosynthesis
MLDSYRGQIDENVELIVVDGGSKDGTMEIIEKNRDIIGKYKSERDKGIYDAWNKAVSLSEAEFVSFIGADDVLACGAVQALLRAISSAPGEVNLIAGFNVMTRNRIPTHLIESRFDQRTLKLKMPVAQLMSAHRRSWLKDAGGFDATYRSSGDYELLIRERSRLNVRIIPDILALMEDGGTSARGIRPFVEDYRARKSNGISPVVANAIFAKAMIGFSLRKLGLKS